MRDRKGRPALLKVGIKYCGGCKPEFDRIAAVKEMKEALGDRIELVPHDSEDACCVLVVCGCKTACVDITEFPGRSVRIIASREDADKWIADMKR